METSGLDSAAELLPVERTADFGIDRIGPDGDNGVHCRHLKGPEVDSPNLERNS
jgi:hypothetical protein